MRPGTSPASDPGAVLAGRFRVERKLGEGGMGVVFECTHLVLGNRVVIKVLKSSTALDAEAHARFLREGRAAALLESPHIVRVLDAGTLESGQPFLCMEKLRGRDLACELAARGGTLPVREAVEYVRQAAEGLQLAHDAGIVHRDIKPANLFLSETGTDARCLKVLDFGIAKARTLGKDDFATTALGSVLGTPYYMSPEQLRSSRGVTGQTDVWSLGVVLFELITGRLPFRAETLAGLTAAILTEPVDLSGIDRSAGPRVAQIVARALEKDVSRRYATMSELLVDLGRARNSESPEAFACTAVDLQSTPPTPADRTTPSPPPRATRPATVLGVSMIAISAVSIAAFIGAISYGAEGAPPPGNASESAAPSLPATDLGTPSASTLAGTAKPIELTMDDLAPPLQSAASVRSSARRPPAAAPTKATSVEPTTPPPVAASGSPEPAAPEPVTTNQSSSVKLIDRPGARSRK